MNITIFGISDTEQQPHKRTEKGKSILDAINDYVALDVETTGLDPQWDEIIQVGCIRVRDGAIAAQYESLVNPGFEIDEYITKLTGITNEMLATAPSIEQIAPDIQNFIGDDCIVGHNVTFDINFLYDTFEKCGLTPLKNNFLCTRRLAYWVFPGWDSYKLKILVDKLQLPDGQFHNAMTDTLHTYHAYEYMKKYAAENGIEIAQIKRHTVKAKDITASSTDFDPDDPFYGKTFVFTGTLLRMNRKDAMQLVADHGGQCLDGVNKQLNYLVVGDYSKSYGVKGGKTTKLKKAEKLILDGQELQIISEDVFFGMLEDYEKIKAAE